MFHARKSQRVTSARKENQKLPGMIHLQPRRRLSRSRGSWNGGLRPFRERRHPALQKRNSRRGGFAAARFVPVNGGDGEEEIIEIIDEEQIRREVAEQLELAQADEQRDLLEPTDEEKYGIDNFDAGAYS